MKDGDKVQPPYKVITRRIVDGTPGPDMKVKTEATSPQSPAVNTPAMLKE